MYTQGDLIIYGSHGVCKVESIGMLTIGKNEAEYYTIVPVFRDGKIYLPVNSNVYMRPLIDVQEVHHLIENILSMKCIERPQQSTQQLTNYYKQKMEEYTCEDLLQILHDVEIIEKKAEEQGRKLGQIDERYKREAENLLYEEFSAVLGITKEEVKPYILSNIG